MLFLNYRTLQILLKQANKVKASWMSVNYRQMYEQKCKELDETNMQFSQYQQQSNFIITDLEQEIKQVKKKNQSLTRQLNQIKEKRKNFTSSYEKQIQQTTKSREQFKAKFMEFQKKVIELENINECLESDLRATKATLYQYEQRTQKTMEQLALLQMQMEESTQSNQEQIARLRSQLKQTQQQLYALHHVKNKNEKENRYKENHNESFHSKQSTAKKSEINESKIRKKNIKFSETLAEIRTYIKQISVKREQLEKKYQH